MGPVGASAIPGWGPRVAGQGARMQPFIVSRSQRPPIRVWAESRRRSASRRASAGCAASLPGSARPRAGASTITTAVRSCGRKTAMLLSQEQSITRDMARNFANERLKPFAAEWDRSARFPAEAIGEMGQLGLLGMLVPEAYDGAATDHVAYALALEEIAAGDGACSTIMSVHNSVGCLPLLKFGTPEQKERFLKPMARGEMLAAFCLTEPEAGSDASAVKTRARRAGNKYVLSGIKQFVTSGAHAKLALVFAVTDPAAGKKGISAFIVPTATPGWRVTKLEHKLGQRASDTAQIVLEEMELTPDLLLGQEGEGYKIALANLEGGRIGIAAQSVGMARAAFEAATGYARERKSFGTAIANPP